LDHNALSEGGSATSNSSRFSQPKPAPLFEIEQSADQSNVSSGAGEKLMELLAGLMSQSAGRGGYSTHARPSWSPRRALVCIPEEKRESLARSLAENGYQVFVAEDTRQAVERMRENQLDVVVVDPRFDGAEQGAVFVTREVNILRPAQRRRLFFVLLSPTLRTMDAHSAFLNNVNAVVNVQDMADLPAMIEHRLRDFNELYKDFNSATNVPAL
jgi:CheY-like chemotaxis protein